jgi:hypothetical protein
MEMKASFLGVLALMVARSWGTRFTLSSSRSCCRWMTPALPVAARLVLKSASILVGLLLASDQSSVSMVQMMPRMPMRPVRSVIVALVLP